MVDRAEGGKCGVFTVGGGGNFVHDSSMIRREKGRRHVQDTEDKF